ncbi:Pr6Pr family membrane protein [Kitasatospora sp. NBC_01560]|uniref:Pr6Pr family membrane protein n=1 Tax=Kitasatospora sp. NBC_01560 TaxID=2975965 RepID=UPI00386C1BDF
MYRWLAPARIAFAALIAVALGFAGHRAATGITGLPDFFSYFGNLSALAAMVVLLLGGLAGRAGRDAVPGTVRGAVLLCTTVTGLAYGLLQAPYPVDMMVPWVHHVVHQAVPAVVLADWLIDPPERRISRVEAAGWLVFPLLYLAYTLLRGLVVDWYPYRFLDPTIPGGYCRVAGASFLTTGAFALAGAVLLWAGNTLADRRDAAAGSTPPGRGAHAAPSS